MHLLAQRLLVIPLMFTEEKNKRLHWEGVDYSQVMMAACHVVCVMEKSKSRANPTAWMEWNFVYAGWCKSFPRDTVSAAWPHAEPCTGTPLGPAPVAEAGAGEPPSEAPQQAGQRCHRWDRLAPSIMLSAFPSAPVRQSSGWKTSQLPLFNI